MFLFKKAQTKQALVRVGAGGTVVSFGQIQVVPFFHHLTIIDLSLLHLSLHLSESQAILCKDFIKADVKVVFDIKVGANPSYIQNVFHSFDTDQLTDPTYLAQWFLPHFEHALRVVGQTMNFEDLRSQPDKLRDMTLEVIGKDLSGFELEDMLVESIERTSFDFYNEDDYLEQQGKAKAGRLAMKVPSKEESTVVGELDPLLHKNLMAEEAKQAFELESVKIEIKQQLEIARLEAEKQVELAKYTAKAEQNKPDDIDLELKKVRAQAQQEKQKIDQLQKEAERIKSEKKNDENNLKP
ncbi:flotillin family protein [Microscilla marina]|uniref:Band 7 domain-containing protein n=1 Tax=Microscilla marina ATCC 23134 TaxID=313606 RepID=A1ZRK4_MICM2|nr:hypothetical protein [Microscilla marina]EAY26909.1 conserved hypothetical protein [Microscilla marina ATCC 23134]